MGVTATSPTKRRRRQTEPTPAQRVSAEWGRLVRERRIEMTPRLTQQQLAKKLRRDQTWVSRYERGGGAWTPEVMLSFAVALDTTVPRLFPWPIGIDDVERYRVRGKQVA